MKILLFGATGMVGQGVLREGLLDPNVESIVTVGRTATAAHHPKLREIVRQDLWNYADIAPDLSGFQACFFCLGVSSAGMTERDYERVAPAIVLNDLASSAFYVGGITEHFIGKSASWGKSNRD